MGTNIVNRGETRIRWMDSWTEPELYEWDAAKAAWFWEYYPTTIMHRYLRYSHERVCRTMRQPAQKPDDTRRHNETPTAAGLFVNDRLLYITSDSLTTNAKKLQKA